MNLAHQHRLRLATLPTPLEPLARLAGQLHDPALWIKRDDLTGLALGGNKARKIEYLLGAARAQGAAVVMTTAGVHSNYLRMFAAGARQAGMQPVLFLRGDRETPRQGNLLLDTLLGAELHFIDVADPWSPEAYRLMEEDAAGRRARGERVAIISVQNTHAPVAALGYVNAAFELYAQLTDRGRDATHIFVTTGSGVTQAGLLLGVRLLRWPVQVVGIAAAPHTAAAHRERIAEIVRATARLLEIPVTGDIDMDPETVVVDDGYAGSGYGQITPGAVDAIRRCGREEAILLDPVYTGKAMHGLLDWIAQGKLTRSDTAIFLHSGGAPNLFAQADPLARALQTQAEGNRLSSSAAD